MELTQIARGECRVGDCPAIFTTDRGTLAVQGDIIDRKVPDGDGIVEIPMDVLKEAVRALGW
jgi:hypothetical protein